MSGFKGGDDAINRRGRPKGSGRKISQVKVVFNQLKKLSTKAISNIEDSVNGKDVDKEVLASSKWVVNTLSTYNKAVLAEEEGLKSTGEDKSDSTEDVDEPPAKSGFSLKIVK